MQRLENIVIDGVPAGGEDDFVVLREVGEIPAFDFEPRDHLELGELLDAIDMERGAKVSGAASTILKGIGARLELAIMSSASTARSPPGSSRSSRRRSCGPRSCAAPASSAQHSDEVYHLEEDDLYLVGTSEVPLAGYHMDEILDLSNGPEALRRLVDLLPPRGRVVRQGHPRHHPRAPVQQARDVQSTRPRGRRGRAPAPRRLQEGMLQDLGLSYRVIDIAAGDLGSSAARKYDVEAWVPTQGAYRELTSTSNCTTFQARRLDIRHRPPSRRQDAHVATLNGTLATTRWIVAILETHQRADGSVVVPEVLRPYLGGLEVLEPVTR